MNNDQTDTDNVPEYPEPFESGWMDTGSRTIDNGMHFTLEVDDCGFHLRKDFGYWSVNDLFGEMGWWPSERAWQGQNAKLLGLIDDLSPKVGLAPNALLDIVREYFIERLGIDIDAYLAEERSQKFSQDDLRSRHASLVDDFRIPGLPSNDLYGEGTCYRGLELAFGADAWSATLWEPEESEALFLPECWNSATLDEILDNTPWTHGELVELLVDSDPRWQRFVDTDFSIVQKS